MRVLSVSDSDWRGGAAKVAHYLTVGLRARGIAADMLVLDKSSGADFVEEIPRSAARPASRRRGLRARIAWRLAYGALRLDSPGGRALFDPGRLAKYDLIHLHDVPPVSYLDLFRKLRLPTVWTLHSMAPLTGNCAYSYGCDRWLSGCGACPQFGTWPLIYQHRDASAEILALKRIVYRRLRFHAVGVSDWSTAQIARGVMRDQPRHTVHNPSWSPDYFPVDRSAARARLGLPADAFAIMFSVSGNPLDLRKGLDIVMTAADSLRTGWSAARPLVFLPTGIIPPGEGMSEILQSLPGLPPRHLSEAADMRDYYNAADVVWHPSRADNCPMACLEAFGCGTPVIAAAVGGVPEIVPHERAGLLIPPDDPAALVAATRRLADSPELCARLREGALQKAAEHSPDRFVTEYLSIYQQALPKGLAPVVAQ